MAARTAVVVVVMEIGAGEGENGHEGSGGEDGAEMHGDLCFLCRMCLRTGDCTRTKEE